MTRDAEKLLKFIVNKAEQEGIEEVSFNVSEVTGIPNLGVNIKRLCQELENNGMVCGYRVYINNRAVIALTLEGLEYFDEKEETNKMMGNKNFSITVSGGQVNVASGNATINATQNNGIYADDNGTISASLNDDSKDFGVVVKNGYRTDKETNILSNGMEGKVFVSYSWTPESNKKWVEQLVHRLESDGIQVVIDFKDLKLGHDKYAFMERTVNDDAIKRVLIICNKTYKEKADGRIGGVGDESAIITPQIYGNVRQEKFIPVVNEYDENGKPFLPNYLASRMYADLTDFEIGYKQLLNNIEEEDAMDESTTEKVENDDIKMFGEPTPFFAHRMGKAFPGVRGKKEFTDPKECVDRLEILLKHPLNKNTQGMTDPIWWFRGGSNLDIEKFTRITPTKFLMNSDEIEVKRVVVYVSRNYFRSFVYVEAFPEESIGIYGEVDQRYVDEMVKICGEHHEEYAVYEGHAITRAEFDDGAAEIDGKIVDITGKAKLRVRYLTPYNFIICAKWNPLNENQYDDRVEDILNGILKGIRTIDELTALVEKIPRHKRDM